jgi:GAF domain-containing protein
VGNPTSLAEAVRETLARLSGGEELRGVLAQVCDVISSASGCESVGIRWRAGEEYPYYVTRGFGRDFVVIEGPLCARDSAGLLVRLRDGTPQLACMCGAVIQGRVDRELPYITPAGSFWTNCTSDLLRDSPPSGDGIYTRNYCNVVGYESVALIPLRAEGRTLGIVQLNSRTPGKFTEEKLAQYERAAEAIAAAVYPHLKDDAAEAP